MASEIEININDTYSAQFGLIEDLSTLWKIHDILTKQIRKVEKNTKGRTRKPRDPTIPKKEATVELLAWNQQIKRIVELSKTSSGGELAYNHSRAIGSLLKKEEKLVISKNGNVIPSDSDVLTAINKYHEIENPGPKPVKEKKVVEKASTVESKTFEGAKNEEGEDDDQDFDVKTYTFIINGKSYDRADNEGNAYIWDQKGNYMGVYDEKTKKFDTSFPNPCA